jgi:glycine cleavage system H protein
MNMAKKKPAHRPERQVSKAAPKGSRRLPVRRPKAGDTLETLTARQMKKTSRDDFSVDPSDLRFTDMHEWVRIKDRNTIVVGITDFAQARLSDITSVELPEPDEHHYEAREEISVIEALNTSAAFHAPVDGMIVATNMELLGRPELINLDPYGSGWLVEMRPDNITDILSFMDFDEYEANLPEDEEE